MKKCTVIILNLFLVLTILFFSSPIEVDGYKSVHYPTGDFYGLPWQSFNPRKRMESVEKNDSIIDGQVLVGDQDMGDAYKPIYFKHEPQIKDEDILFKSKKPSDTKMRTRNYAQSGYGIKVLYGRVPDTFIFWPSTL